MISWSNVAIAIPTVASRLMMRVALTEQLLAACPGATVVVTEHVAGRPARETFPRALAAAAAIGCPWVLQLEDDVALAPTFQTDALAVGLGDDTDVLTLFSRSRADVDAMAAGQLLRRIGPGSFSMSQGFFIRRELAAGVQAFAPGWYEKHPEHNRAADLLLGAYLSERRARVLVRVPSLVQHRRGPSTLPNHRGARQSESFRAAFGEVM